MDGGRRGTCRVAVLSILEEEFDQVHRVFGPLTQLAGTSFWTPDPVSLDIVAARAPTRSNVPATQAAMRLIEHFRPEILIVVGIGASVVRENDTRDAYLGDVVVPDYLHYAEYGKIAGGRHLRRYQPFDQPNAGLLVSEVDATHRDGSWIERVGVDPPERPAVPEGRTWPRAVIGGSLVACEKVLSDPHDSHQHMLIDEFQDTRAVDMESYGAASAVHEARSSVNYNPRLIVIRGISDYVYATSEQARGDDNQATREAWRPFSAAAAVTFAFELTRRVLRLDDERAELRRAERDDRSDQA